MILPRFCYLLVSEALAQNFTCLCNNDECLRVNGEYLSTKSNGLGASAYGDDNSLVGACICALGRVGCNAVANVLHYVLIDLVGLGGDDGKGLAHIDRVDDIVKDEYLGEKTDQREKTRLGGKADMTVFEVHKRRRGDDNIGAEKRCGNVKSGILLQNKCQNVCTTRGCLALEDYCGSYSGQKNGVYKLKEGILGKCRADRYKILKQHILKRKCYRAINRHKTALFTEYQKSEYKK